MKVKNVTSIFFTKFDLVYKMILFLLIITLLISMIGAGIILPVINGLRKDVVELGLDSAIVKYIKAILSGSNPDVAYNNLFDTFGKIPQLIQKWDINITISVAVFVVMILIFSIFYYMSYYTISDILHQFMSSNSKFGFMSNYIYNAKKSFIFAIVYAPIAIVYFILMGLLVLGLSFLVAKFSPTLSVMVGYLLFILGLSLRRMIFAFWIPAMVKDGLSLKDALKKNFELLKGRASEILGEYFMICIAGVMFTIISAIATLGVGIIISYTIIWFIMEITDMVGYYKARGHKFYIDDQTVVDPKKKFKDAILDDVVL